MFLDKFLRKNDFIVIGAQKAGTTALDYYFRKHKDLVMPKRKELHHFDNDLIFRYLPNFVLNFLYHKNFNDLNQKYKKYGEITPIYMYWDNCLKRIKNYNEEIKVIVILRNPIERSFSHWNMEYDRGNELRSFEDAIKQESSDILNNKYKKDRIISYLDRGFYSRQVIEILSLFKRDQVLFLKYEDFKDDQENQLKIIYTFLNISTSFEYQNKLIHKRVKHSNLEDSTKQFLNDFFSEDISKLEEILNWNCDDWKI
ncbi:sulfotransferase domain-containing protein [Flammeovirga sp. EKP202]|uniref:sulfotransferase domain-containing protein n=1 Tax=Flammeovirga sp. EKP202 TaxID=2770592 RepID=UPI00165F66D7|nr:sulfotransferase domain-containing protein [Flammeovirga sp. EKP202]MBD0400837.1 sulfotransferase domain-containing protein [Flammeovirga sp. EKP202]